MPGAPAHGVAGECSLQAGRQEISAAQADKQQQAEGVSTEYSR